jgi:hypothetical protein
VHRAAGGITVEPEGVQAGRFIYELFMLILLLPVNAESSIL